MAKRTRKTVEAPRCDIACPGHFYSCDIRGYHFTDEHGDQVHAHFYGQPGEINSRTVTWTSRHPAPHSRYGRLAPAR